MQDIVVRNCDINDMEKVHRLNIDALGYDFPLAKTNANLKKLLNSRSDLILVAEISGKVVGYIHASDYDLIYAPHMKNIMGIAVFEQYRRRGVGKALLCAVEQWAAQTGADAIRLCSGEEREDAHEFYKSVGYIYGKKQLNFKKEL